TIEPLPGNDGLLVFQQVSGGGPPNASEPATKAKSHPCHAIFGRHLPRRHETEDHFPNGLLQPQSREIRLRLDTSLRHGHKQPAFALTSLHFVGGQGGSTPRQRHASALTSSDAALRSIPMLRSLVRGDKHR